MRTGGSKYELMPFSKDKFFFDGDTSTLQFIRNAQNGITSVILKSTGRDKSWIKTDKVIPKITALKVDEDLFAKYMGEYALTEAFHLKIFKTDKKMYAQATGQQKVEIVSTAEHKFSLIGVDAQLTFHFEDEDKASSLTLHQNGDHEAKRVE